ncbi:hypothetical protein B0H12DRAFT_1080660 [Mycena haematopus]|nr:hypothetical protein B0H12DRAFT_1080660 [Mycena haematopus]
MTLDLPVPDWCGGDWNIVEEPIDRLPHRPDEPTATAALARFKRLLELKDGWRNVNPDAKSYTYTGTHGTVTHSRLDRIYDVPGKLTDHRMVSVIVSAPFSPFIGMGRYSLPLFILKDKEFLDFTIAEGAKAEGMYERVRTDTDNLQITFKNWKDTSTEFGHARATAAVGALEQKKRKLQKEREDILSAPTETHPATPEHEYVPAPEPDPDETGSDSESLSADDDGSEAPSVSTGDQDSTAVKLAKIQGAIDVLVSRQRERNRKETQIKCRTELDRITKFTVRMKMMCPQLKATGGRTRWLNLRATTIMISSGMTQSSTRKRSPEISKTPSTE